MKQSLIRLLSHGHDVGNAFVTCEGYIVTCAHVINNTLQVKDGSVPVVPNGTFEAELHWLPTRPRVPLYFVPKSYVYDKSGTDIACFTFLSRTPVVEGLQLSNSSIDRFNAWCQPYKADGDQGAIIRGKIDGTDHVGRVSFSAIEHDRPFIEQGFSGAPIFAENDESVAAMITWDDTCNARQAYAVHAKEIQIVLDNLKIEETAPRETIPAAERDSVPMERPRQSQSTKSVKKAANISAHRMVTFIQNVD